MKKKYYLVYEVEAENEEQVQAVAAELFQRLNLEPSSIFLRFEWDIKKFIDKLLKH